METGASRAILLLEGSSGRAGIEFETNALDPFRRVSPFFAVLHNRSSSTDLF